MLPAPGRPRRPRHRVPQDPHRHGHRPYDWIAAVEAEDQPDLHSSACGLKHDHDAVRNGLTMPWN
jgi:hypothetical protein